MRTATGGKIPSIKRADTARRDWAILLGRSVIYQAIRDAKGIGILSTLCGNSGKWKDITCSRVIAEAREFMNASEELRIWCSIAEISYSKVISVYRRDMKCLGAL